jgi:diketogulonate reductase-like aldo/keto reductase
MTDLLRAALGAGYRHIDTAILYENHKMIGGALKTIFSEGKYSRDDVFITTKVFPFRNFNCIQKLEESLKDLQLSYVDLYMVHWPCVPFSKDLII